MEIKNLSKKRKHIITFAVVATVVVVAIIISVAAAAIFRPPVYFDEDNPQPGLYDDKGKRIVSWDTLVNLYKMDCEVGMPLPETLMGDLSEAYGLMGKMAEEEGEKILRMPCTVFSVSGRLKKGVTLVIDESVTKIGAGAFAGCANLQYILIPDSVEKIGPGAFMMCSNLRSITIPKELNKISGYVFAGCCALEDISIIDGLTSIGEHAFMFCEAMRSIDIPGSATHIGNYAFSYCTSLSSISLPTSVELVGDAAFYGCDDLSSVEILGAKTVLGLGTFAKCAALTKIEVTNKNDLYTSLDGVLYSKDGKTLIQYPVGKNTSAYVVPDKVTHIESFAFAGNTSLETIEIPSGIVSVGDWCFDDIPSLLYNEKDGVKYLGNDKDAYVVAVAANTNISCINLPESLKAICTDAFTSCIYVTEILIPSNVISVNQSAFRGLPSLEKIAVDENNSAYHADGNCLVETGSKTLIAGCKTSIIPGGGSVTTIGAYAFYNCTSLTSITIPDSVTTINDNAFMGCTSLTSITIPNSVTTIDESAFSDCTSLTSINYGGTVEQWTNDISFGTEWDINTGNYTVYCTDGTVAKDGTVTMN